MLGPRKAQKIAPAQSSMTVDDLWERLPPELLRAIVEVSLSPLRVYIQLLGLSHVIRARVRGTLRELSFAEPDPILPDIVRPTFDVVATLVGPCKSLTHLSFPVEIDMRGGLIQSGAAGWVDEAFGGHTQLAVLSHLPTRSEPEVERILSHLPGLAVLTINTWTLQMSAHLLAALVRFCPGLQVLQCSVSDGVPPDALAGLLAPLSGVLKELYLGARISDASLGVLVRSLSAMTSLKLPHCPPAALKPIAPHLTSLALSVQLRAKDLPGPWLCHLEELSFGVKGSFSAPVARLLAANQATLRSLSLGFSCLKLTDKPSLMVSLRALPHLTCLDLSRFRLSAPPPPELVDRLERLNISLQATPDPVLIASRHLQQLDLQGNGLASLALRCPALVELRVLFCRLISLQCPRLRTITTLTPRGLDGAAGRPLPDLETFAATIYTRDDGLLDPAWLLTGSPRLRFLSGVRLTRRTLVARLCASESLVLLRDLYLDVTQLPNPLTLRLPGQVELFDVHIERKTRSPAGRRRTIDLHVEAPGLRNFLLKNDPELPHAGMRIQLRNCPALDHLGIRSEIPVFLRVASAVMMQPRRLDVECLEAASMVDFLIRHGARLHTVSATLHAVDDWPQLMGALSGLPRLTSLDMSVAGSTGGLALSCPQLRRLGLGGLHDGAKVVLVLSCPQLRALGLRGLPDEAKAVLACPLLEELIAVACRAPGPGLGKVLLAGRCSQAVRVRVPAAVACPAAPGVG
ncbi:hypothetical protein PAPYR_8188 [Paratrimastix pyriformis]|uniref:Uncharacterized protein n=1 Tax=Paratrimastix pyriformis TaxID=342808 RepID=A0ABQ8UGU8_9EUKA|nr:hypothetical protein PAPYR_8188 [Paratrimastix pyriformis]